MGQEESKNNKQGRKNLFNKDTGLPIMINLYVMKYIYSHIKKAECFIMERKQGKKPKSYPVYQDFLQMSRQRFERMCNGENFQYTVYEAEAVTSLFGLDIKYFSSENPIPFGIDGIENNDWKCFFNNKYSAGYDMEDDDTKEGEDKADKEDKINKIESKLKELAQGKWEKLNSNDPVYAVCFYFHYGKRFDAPDNIKVITQTLSGTDYREWDSQSMEVLKEAGTLLRKHYNYVNSLLTLEKMRSEK